MTKNYIRIRNYQDVNKGKLQKKIITIPRDFWDDVMELQERKQIKLLSKRNMTELVIVASLRTNVEIIEHENKGC